MNAFNLKEHQLTVEEVYRNLPPRALYEHAILYEKDAHVAENGALVAYSGVKTGRSPKDKRVVKQSPSEGDVWWGPVNIALEPQAFAINRERARDYLNSRERLYCFDGFAGWDSNYRIKVRVICSRPYHALFMHTMLIRPTKDELQNFGTPEFVIYNAGAFPANRLTAGMGSKTSVDLSLVLENVVLDEDRLVDYSDISITENTRGAYPIEFIRNAKIPCVAGHPSDIIFLTCDAFGVLPPVSSLSPAQAMDHFISGYTAKVAGTEVGVKEPSATFSPCFGGPFLVWHPSKYAELLAAKMKQHGTRVWLVNTGWSGGAYGTGKRIKLAHTRAIVDAIHAGVLAKAETQSDPVFGLNVVTQCPGVPSEILVPRNAWSEKASYEAAAKKFAGLFTQNFAKYEAAVSAEVRSAGPVV